MKAHFGVDSRSKLIHDDPNRYKGLSGITAPVPRPDPPLRTEFSAGIPRLDQPRGERRLAVPMGAVKRETVPRQEPAPVTKPRQPRIAAP
jgi:hypothetical protein